MDKVEQYIQDYTRHGSNEIIHRHPESNPYTPWLTPDHAREVAKIAREETIEEAFKWIEHNILNYVGKSWKEIGVSFREALNSNKKK